MPALYNRLGLNDGQLSSGQTAPQASPTPAAPQQTPELKEAELDRMLRIAGLR
jgi:hypothetical protein